MADGLTARILAIERLMGAMYEFSPSSSASIASQFAMKSMLRLDDDAQRFYAALSARAEAEDYCPIEQLTGLPNCTSTTPEELDSLLRELLCLSDGYGQGLQQEEA